VFLGHEPNHPVSAAGSFDSQGLNGWHECVGGDHVSLTHSCRAVQTSLSSGKRWSGLQIRRSSPVAGGCLRHSFVLTYSSVLSSTAFVYKRRERPRTPLAQPPPSTSSFLWQIILLASLLWTDYLTGASFFAGGQKIPWPLKQAAADCPERSTRRRRRR
jgi:hypothetical protein